MGDFVGLRSLRSGSEFPVEIRQTATYIKRRSIIVEVFAIKSVEEMQMCMDAGLDRWGLELGKEGIMPSEMSFEKTRQVFKATPSKYPKMALTIDTDSDDLVEIVTETQPDSFHLCGDTEDLPPECVF